MLNRIPSSSGVYSSVALTPLGVAVPEPVISRLKH